MTDQLLEDLDTLMRINGLFIGQLSDEEQRVFNKSCKEGRAYRDYGGPAGFFLGLGKVRMVRQDG